MAEYSPLAQPHSVPVHTVGDSGSLDDLEARASGPSPVGAFASSVAVPPHRVGTGPPAASGEVPRLRVHCTLHSLATTERAHAHCGRLWQPG